MLLQCWPFSTRSPLDMAMNEHILSLSPRLSLSFSLSVSLTNSSASLSVSLQELTLTPKDLLALLPATVQLHTLNWIQALNRMLVVYTVTFPYKL